MRELISTWKKKKKRKRKKERKKEKRRLGMNCGTFSQSPRTGGKSHHHHHHHNMGICAESPTLVFSFPCTDKPGEAEITWPSHAFGLQASFVTNTFFVVYFTWLLQLRLWLYCSFSTFRLTEPSPAKPIGRSSVRKKDKPSTSNKLYKLRNCITMCHSFRCPSFSLRGCDLTSNAIYHTSHRRDLWRRPG